MADAKKPAETISGNMTGGAPRDTRFAQPPLRLLARGCARWWLTHARRTTALCVYSCLFMRFAWAVQVRAPAARPALAPRSLAPYLTAAAPRAAPRAAAQLPALRLPRVQ